MHDKGRRRFLLHTAAGVSAATVGLLTETQAQPATSSPSPEMAMPGAAKKPASHGEGVGAFFNVIDARTVAAFAERIMPGAPGIPGATDADVLNYIDLALAGAYADQQEFYRHGLTQLDAYCKNTFGGNAFFNLAPAEQDQVVEALESGKATGFSWPTAQEFFTRLRTHTMEGMFADPVYGGNKDFAGWRLVGFPGAQVTFTAEDMASSGPFTRSPIIGMQS